MSLEDYTTQQLKNELERRGAMENFMVMKLPDGEHVNEVMLKALQELKQRVGILRRPDVMSVIPGDKLAIIEMMENPKEGV